MYVFLYAGILFVLTHFDIVRASDHNLTNGLMFGGLFISFVILRIVILKVTMPAPPPIPVAPNASTNGALLGFFADVVTGGTGVGTTIGQIYDEETNWERATGYTTNLQKWAFSYEQDIVAPLVRMAIVSVLIAFLVTVIFAYGIGIRFW